VKQADLWPCDSRNIGTVSNRVFWKEQNPPNTFIKRVIGEACVKFVFWKLKITAGIRNMKNQPTWHAQPIKFGPFLPYGSPLSALRLPSHKDQYHVTGFYKVLVPSLQLLLHRWS
jgi:hypothetical protein